MESAAKELNSAQRESPSDATEDAVFRKVLAAQIAKDVEIEQSQDEAAKAKLAKVKEQLVESLAKYMKDIASTGQETSEFIGNADVVETFQVCKRKLRKKPTHNITLRYGGKDVVSMIVTKNLMYGTSFQTPLSRVIRIEWFEDDESSQDDLR